MREKKPMDILNGIRIVSFNHFFMGPVGIQLLADLGADVIAIEPIGGAFQRHWGGANKSIDGQTMLFLLGNRNKRSLALDLKKPEGLEIARKLAAGADVVTENFRPGVMEKLGLGYEDLKAKNPALIYASASGYGPDGPYAERPGQDLLIQAMSGLMAITGSEEGGARAVGVSAADHHGAALLAMGILAALVGRLRNGRGRRVDVNLLSSAIDLQLESFVCYLNGEAPDSVRQPKHIAGWYYPAPYGRGLHAQRGTGRNDRRRDHAKDHRGLAGNPRAASDLARPGQRLRRGGRRPAGAAQPELRHPAGCDRRAGDPGRPSGPIRRRDAGGTPAAPAPRRPKRRDPGRIGLRDGGDRSPDGRGRSRRRRGDLMVPG
jgi:crotonobetainyl-CoA:carnitine CoA-transferase CaiB-like acyl-CoA transferase